MKRDMDLVGQILIAIEDHPHGYAPASIAVSDYTEETIGYHLLLMGEAGLLDVEETSTFGARSPSATAKRMTGLVMSSSPTRATTPSGRK